MPNQYRRQDCTLFKLIGNDYVCVYTNSRIKTLKALIAAYEEKMFRDSQSDI